MNPLEKRRIEMTMEVAQLANQSRLAEDDKQMIREWVAKFKKGVLSMSTMEELLDFLRYHRKMTPRVEQQPIPIQPQPVVAKGPMSACEARMEKE